jgi:hypothetical protein
MTDNLTLTRYLYFADEVSLSLLDCLIAQRDLNEALFWMDELYSSGFVEKSWLLIWQIYFDFYAIINPLFMKKLSKYWKKSRTLENILYIVKNLFHLNSSYQVFLFRIKKYDTPLTVYLPPSITKQERILQAIKYGHIANLRYLINNYNFANIDFLKNYFIDKKKSSFEYFDYPKELSENFTYYYILSHMELGETVKAKHIGRKLTEEDKILSAEVGKDDTIGWSRYKVLSKKRLYTISEHIGCFERTRDDVVVFDKRMVSLNEIYWYYWLYFTQYTPLWAERIKTFEGKFNSKKLCVEFPDDEKSEKFYKKYNLEPDEQSNECHNKSLKEIPEITIGKWLQTRFDVEIDTRCDMVNYKIELK